MIKVYLAILFITMTAFIVNGTVTNFTGNDFDESVDNVLAYTQQTEQLFEQGFLTIFGTAQALVNTVDNITSFWLAFTSSTPIFATPEETVNVICTPYEELLGIRQAVYITRNTIYNIFNSPNLTVQEFYALDRGLEFGINWNEVCA